VVNRNLVSNVVEKKKYTSWGDVGIRRALDRKRDQAKASGTAWIGVPAGKTRDGGNGTGTNKRG